MGQKSKKVQITNGPKRKTNSRICTSWTYIQNYPRWPFPLTLVERSQVKERSNLKQSEMAITTISEFLKSEFVYIKSSSPQKGQSVHRSSCYCIKLILYIIYIIYYILILSYYMLVVQFTIYRLSQNKRMLSKLHNVLAWTDFWNTCFSTWNTSGFVS